MAILIPTKDTGAATKPNPMLYVEPAQQMTDDALKDALPETGMNSAFFADVLSAMLTHERCGVHLYRAVSGRTNNPVLQAKYREFGRETERHVEILETLIREMGGNPSYVSPNARAVEGTNTKVLEATYAGSGSLDPMTQEMVLLDAVFIAESIDHDNWQTLSRLVEDLPDGELRDSFDAAVAEVEAQEDEHLAWASDTKQHLIVMQAQSGAMARIGMKAEELVATVRAWLSE
jgi:rubrerythrin